MKHNHRVPILFNAASELPPAERQAFLDRECEGDQALKGHVADLLAAAAVPTDQRLRLSVWRSQSDKLNTLGLRGHVTELYDPALDAARPRSSDAPRALSAGTRILQYELIRELGRGGMGAVYLARDTKLGRRVAIKFLHKNQPEQVDRFIREAQVTARCVHENIVVIHEVNQHQGQPFMVLEYLRGRPLSALIENQTLPPNRAVQLIVPVVRALVCAHKRHILHRDLKPENIIVTDSGGIKVLDFGIAKFVYEIDGGSATARLHAARATIDMTVPNHDQLTMQGSLIGTMAYMSPEQWLGVDVDLRTDIWAVGVLLYRMITGKHPLAPLRGPQLMVTGALEQPMPSAHDASVHIPGALADIIDSCLKKHKRDRIPDAERLLDMLEPLLPGHQALSPDSDQAPYAGLTAFQEADASRFFGRSRDIDAMLGRLHEHPLIGVIGPSGVGKSSFVRAGVIPALKASGEDWQSLVIRPGRQPVAALARVVSAILDEGSGVSTTLSEDSPLRPDIMRRLYNEPGYVGAVLRSRARKKRLKVILFVDQFEELYTLTPDLRERLAFTTALAGVADDAASPLRVVLSIRSDFVDRVAEDREFMADVGQGLYFLTQPDRSGLREAITRPAEMLGYRFESPWIVEQMLDSLEETPGALPLLQFTAARLWETRDQAQRLLTERSYRHIGGIEGALASHANAVLTGLSPRDQTLVRAIFLQLVTTQRTRAIAAVTELSELSDEPGVIERLLDCLVTARLLVVQSGDADAGALVEIVHESLIHSWPMLNHWLDENQEDAPYLDQLKAAARQWDAKGRPAGLLWRGDAASEAESWYRHYRGLLPRLQTHYLDAVFALAARTARRKRALVASSMMLLSLLVVAATVALVLIRAAEQEARSAEREARAAEHEARAAQTTIQAQLDEIQAKDMARRAAETRARALEVKANQATTQVELSREQLAEKNRSLWAALETAEQESARARAAERRALAAHEAAEAANKDLSRILGDKRRELKRANSRLKRLEAKVGRIHDDLEDIPR